MFKMKYILALSGFLLMMLTQGHAQSPAYYFSHSLDTAYESNAIIIAGYVKTDTVPTVADSVVIILKSGTPIATHMDTTSSYVINFAAGQDSAPFTIRIMKDTFPEYPEHVLYVLTNPVNGATIGVDSSLLFVLIDTTPPATISMVADTGSAWLHSDTFPVCVNIFNPNPFYIRYYTRTYDCWFYTPLAHLTACGGATYDYTYNWDTLYAPPGSSIVCENINIVPNTVIAPDKKMMVVIQNVDANTILDSTFIFTIRNDNSYKPPSISFDTNSAIIRSDSFSLIGIPISIVSNNYVPYTFNIDTLTFTSNTNINANASSHFTIINGYFTPPYGVSHDTVWISIPPDPIILDTVKATLSIHNVLQNTSTDTLFYLTIIDSGSLVLSFHGAGFSHLKSDSIGYVQVYTSSPVNYPVSVNITYLNGDAIRDTDFIFDDTTIIFPPNLFDTISVPVIMLQDHIRSGNTQINLQLSNVNPSSVQYGISQYSFFIIDDEDSGLAALGIQKMNTSQNIEIYPNPTDNEINISTSLSKYNINIINSIGEKLYDLTDQNGNILIDLSQQPTGIYLIRISDNDFSYTKKILKY
jgi:hypothetical protein